MAAKTTKQNDKADIDAADTARAATGNNPLYKAAAKAESQLADERAPGAIEAIARPESVLDLPDDVKNNLVGYEEMELDELLMGLLAQFSKPVTADRLILMLYQQHGKTPNRLKVLARLRGLADLNLIKKVEGARSQYQATEEGLPAFLRPKTESAS